VTAAATAIPTPLAELLTAAAEFWREHRYGPSARAVQAGLGISSTSVVAYRLKQLKDAGLVDFDEGVAGSLRVTVSGWRSLGMAPPSPVLVFSCEGCEKTAVYAPGPGFGGMSCCGAPMVLRIGGVTYREAGQW